MEVALDSVMSRGWRSLGVHVRESLDCLEGTVRHMDMKVDFGEISDRNEDHVVGRWRKDDSCSKAVEILAEVCSVQSS